MRVLCFFNNNDGTQDKEVLEFHVVEEYVDSIGKKQKRGFVFSDKHGIYQIDTAFIPKASFLETLALRVMLKISDKQQLLKESSVPQIKEKNDDWS